MNASPLCPTRRSAERPPRLKSTCIDDNRVQQTGERSADAPQTRWCRPTDLRKLRTLSVNAIQAQKFSCPSSSSRTSRSLTSSLCSKGKPRTCASAAPFESNSVTAASGEPRWTKLARHRSARESFRCDVKRIQPAGGQYARTSAAANEEDLKTTEEIRERVGHGSQLRSVIAGPARPSPTSIQTAAPVAIVSYARAVRGGAKSRTSGQPFAQRIADNHAVRPDH